METYFAATGPLHWLRLFETTMEAQTFAMEGIAPTGQPVPTNMGGLIEPIQLYRFITPDNPATNSLVWRTLKFHAPSTAKDTIKSFPIFAIRKMLALQKVPEFETQGPILSVNTDHIQLIPLGIKEDVSRVMGSTGVYQEAL